MAVKPGSKKKAGNTRRSVDAGDKDKLIIEQKKHIAVLENELRLKEDLSSQDIERERAEDELRKNEKFLNNVFNCIQDGVSVLSKDLSIIRYNPTIEKWHGKDLTGKKCYRIFHGREEPCETCPSLRAMREKTMQREVVRDLIGWKELYAYPLVNDEGEVTGTIEQVRDITESKKAEETLRENHRFTNTLMGNLPGMVYRRRNVKDWTMEFVSSGCLKLTGYKIEDLFLDRKISYGQLIHPDDRERVWDETQLSIHANMLYTLTYRITTAGQEEKWVLEQGRGIIKNNKVLLEGFITDITDRKRADEKIAHLASFPELNPNPIFEVGTDGMLMYSNPVTARLFPDLKALGADHPLLRGFKDLVTEFEKGRSALVRDINYGDVFYQQTIHFVRESGIVRFYNLDITKRKQDEEALKKANEQTELYLDLMGHDINNMNQIAMGYLELAQDIQADEAQKEYIDKPIEVLQRSTQLIRNVRKLQKIRDGLSRTESVDVCQLLVDVQREFGALPHKQITLNLNGCERCLVRANELLQDVFVNLVTNAIKHTGDRADIVVDLDVVRNKGIQYCRVMVEDNGPGIPDDFKGRIFHRMRKGDSNAKGMGLGLYLVKSLVDSYNGHVWVEDRVLRDHTKGARFVVMLPAVNHL